MHGAGGTGTWKDRTIKLVEDETRRERTLRDATGRRRKVTRACFEGRIKRTFDGCDGLGVV